MSPEFHDLVGDEGTPEELERLRRVHDLLVAAGPPPELPPRLADAPAPGRSPALVAWLPRRRLEAAPVAAAAGIATPFPAGVLLGGRGPGLPAPRTQRQAGRRGG